MNRYENPIYNWVSPAPGMYRTGFEEIYRQGVTPQALRDMAMRLYGDGLENLQGWAIKNQQPQIQEFVNNLRNRQIYNSMRGYPDNGRYTGI